MHHCIVHSLHCVAVEFFLSSFIPINLSSLEYAKYDRWDVKISEKNQLCISLYYYYTTYSQRFLFSLCFFHQSFFLLCECSLLCFIWFFVVLHLMHNVCDKWWCRTKKRRTHTQSALAHKNKYEAINASTRKLLLVQKKKQTKLKHFTYHKTVSSNNKKCASHQINLR